MRSDRTSATHGNQDAIDAARREAITSMMRFAIYVTPAMTVLVNGAQAHHKPGHCRRGGADCFSPA